jgi:sorbitol-specific phosphotransferase system component IIBC
VNIGKNCLFTYIDEDNYVDEDDRKRQMTTSTKETLTKMAEQKLNWETSKNHSSDGKTGNAEMISMCVMKVNLSHNTNLYIVSNNTRAHVASFHKKQKKVHFTAMHIMAFLYVER